jgi:hypothetical protein
MTNLQAKVPAGADKGFIGLFGFIAVELSLL